MRYGRCVPSSSSDAQRNCFQVPGQGVKEALTARWHRRHSRDVGSRWSTVSPCADPLPLAGLIDKGLYWGCASAPADPHPTGLRLRAGPSPTHRVCQSHGDVVGHQPTITRAIAELKNDTSPSFEGGSSPSFTLGGGEIVRLPIWGTSIPKSSISRVHKLERGPGAPAEDSG